uniref:Wu:fc23c09 n=1 Tax=Latimeria chalumnae TaxID=7897 RepID=H3A9P1_LATCH
FEDHYCPPNCACYGRVVQCSDKGVDKIPYGIPYNTRYLFLMNNKIDLIQLDLLNGYLSLEFLVLNNNKLMDESIEEAFEGVPKMTRLFLDQNKLSSVPIDLPPSLEELRLNYNNISYIAEQALARCKSLKVISLNNNSITDESIIKGAFSSLKKLQIIRLNFNQLTTVPANLTTSLKELYLVGNQITRIPENVFVNSSDLRSLNLNSNQITNEGIIKETFYQMAKLEHLNLGQNLLTSVPQHLPKSLKVLILNQNSITSVKRNTFLELKILEQIDLSSNKISTVAMGTFKGMSGLQHLDISNNQLSQVPRQLPLILQSLFLYNNQIRYIPRDSFCGHQDTESHLILIRLENNYISDRNIDVKALRCLRGPQVVHF